MRIFKTFLMTLLLSMIVSSCGGKSKTNLKVSVAAITGSLQFPAGLIVMGKNLKETESFMQRVGPSDVLELELTNGVWNFAIIGWDGNAFFEGANYCGFAQRVRLEGGEVSPSLVASKKACASLDPSGSLPLFGEVGADEFGNAQFPKLEFNSCGGVSHYIKSGDDISPEIYCGPGNQMEVIPGGMKSFRVSIGMNPYGGVRNFKASASCVSESSKVTAQGPLTKGFSNIKLPRGSKLFPFAYKIEVYKKPGCVGEPNDVLFWKEGLRAADQSFTGYSAFKQINNTSQLVIHADLCNAAQVENTPFGNNVSSENDTRLICTKELWANIDNDLGTGANLGKRFYVLGRDIDLGGSNTTITNTFKGRLRGSQFKIFNGNNPLFSTISVLDDDVRISDLLVSNMNIVLGQINGSFGVLANQVIGNTFEQEIELDHITLDASNSIVGSTGVVSTTGRFVGGLIGKVDYTAPGSNNSFSIREIRSSLNLDTTEDIFRSSTTGGLIGHVDGAGCSGFCDVNIEHVSIGGDKTLVEPAYSNLKTIIKGAYNVGGVVGHANDIDIRDESFIHVDVSGTERVGGVIGNAESRVNIFGTFVDVKLRSILSTGLYFGGLIGHYMDIAAPDARIEESLVYAEVDSSSNIINNLGGVAGLIHQDTNLGVVKISNTKAKVKFGVNGENIGGLIGEYNDYFQLTFDNIIENSIVQGEIAPLSSDPNNLQRGGFIGYNIRGGVALSRVYMNKLEGNGTIGGAFGFSDNGSIIESTVNVDYLSALNTTEASIKIGGIIGESQKNSSAFAGEMINKVIASGNLYTSSFDCAGSATCGKVIGLQAYNGGSIELADSISEVVLQNNIGSDVLCGAGSFCIDRTDLLRLFQGRDNETDCNQLIVNTSPVIFEFTNSKCHLTFARNWNLMGVDGLNLLAGNTIEPFKISSVLDWNKIKDRKLLINKTYALQNNIDFSQKNFFPLGGNSPLTSFSGRIISNGFKLSNISYTTTDVSGGAMYSGLIPLLTEGSIGNRNEPLVIENLQLNCTFDSCGVVGGSNGGSIHVIVKNGFIQASDSIANNLGGILGSTASGTMDTELESSGFNGSIDASGVTNVGGLVGDISSSSVRAENNHVNLIDLKGSDRVGGMFGNVAININVDDSYVTLKGSVAGTTPDLGGLAGNVSSPDNYIRNVFIDHSKAIVLGDFQSIAGLTSSGFINSENMFVISPNNQLMGSDISGSALLADSQQSIFDSGFSDGYQWNLDSNGDLKLEMEMEMGMEIGMGAEMPMP